MKGMNPGPTVMLNNPELLYAVFITFFLANILLIPLGCDNAQGYGIARPMPAHQVPEWVACWRPDVRWQQRDKAPL